MEANAHRILQVMGKHGQAGCGVWGCQVLAWMHPAGATGARAAKQQETATR